MPDHPIPQSFCSVKSMWSCFPSPFTRLFRLDTFFATTPKATTAIASVARRPHVFQPCTQIRAYYSRTVIVV